MSPLVSREILRGFVHILTADGKYPVQSSENLQLRIQMQLSEKQKNFLYFFLHFWILHQILNILKEKMIVIANVYPKLRTMIILVRPLSKKGRFRKRFHIQHGKASQLLAKSP